MNREYTERQPDPYEFFPENAKCVFAGKIFDVWQWEQEMFDGSTQTFENLRRRSSSMVIPVVDGKILLQKETQPQMSGVWKWSLPGGSADSYNEAPVDVARRELLEESGLEAEELVFFVGSLSIGKVLWPRIHFIGKNCKKVAELKLDPGEKVEHKLVGWDEFVEIVTRDDFRVTQIRDRFKKAVHSSEDIKELRRLVLG